VSWYGPTAFDAQDHANLFLSLDVGELPANKTRILRLDLGKSAAREMAEALEKR
jgi:hypothetical protein